ncbi:hypothetical protein N779_16870 [Vibrio coralliilyticus OCN008]|nr:hypothetical protein N779_16870 [Vibrio coralliilyticus OCN008]
MFDIDLHFGSLTTLNQTGGKGLNKGGFMD